MPRLHRDDNTSEEEAMNDLEALKQLLADTPVLVTGQDKAPSGVTDLASLGLASHALAVELAANHAGPSEMGAILARHDRKNGDAAYAVLVGAVQSLILTYLEPAMQALDGYREFDLRAHAIEAWKTLEEASDD